MKAKISKPFFLLIILAFLFLLISCSNPDKGLQAENDQLKARIAELEKERQTPAEQTSDAGEEPSVQEEIVEATAERDSKNFAPVLVSSLNTQGYSNAAFVVDDYLYTAGQGISVIDVADKNNPKLIGELLSDQLVDIYVEGNYAYTIYSNWDSKTGFYKGGLKIIDISNKQSPAEVSKFNMEARTIDLAVSGNYAFVSYDSRQKPLTWR